MNCDDVKDLLAERPADVAGGEAAKHVAGCADCRGSVRALGMVRAALNDIPVGYPRAATLEAIRAAARESARANAAVQTGAAARRYKETRGSVWAWLFGPAMRPALGFAAVGAVALAVVLSTGSGDRAHRDDLSGRPERAGEGQPLARPVPASTPPSEAAPTAGSLSAAPTPLSPGGMSAGAVADALKDEPAMAAGAPTAVVTPSTKARAKKEVDKTSGMGAVKSWSGESLAVVAKLKAAPERPAPTPPPAAAAEAAHGAGGRYGAFGDKGVAAGSVAKAAPKPVDTSRADRIGVRDTPRESAEGQELARATEPGSIGAAAAAAPSGDESGGASRYGSGTYAKKQMATERAPAGPAANAAPSAPPRLMRDAKERKADEADRGAKSEEVAQSAVPTSSRASDDLNNAQVAVKDRDYVGAQRILLPRYGKTPREPQVALLLAETHIALKQWKDAAAVLEALLKRVEEGPHVDRVLTLLEKVYAAQKDTARLDAVRARRSSTKR